IYVSGLALGTTTLSVTAAGYNNGTSNVTVDPSGFFIYSPGSFSTTTFSADTSITVYAALLNATTLNFANYGTVRAGVTASVPVTSSVTGVGTITTSPVVIGGNVSFNTTTFHPVAAGSTNITLGTPTGGNFSTSSSSQSITATVTAPTINMSNLTVGR